MKRSLVMAALGSAAILFAFVVPSPAPSGHFLGSAMGNMLHVLLFAVLAFLWARALPPRWRGGWLWAMLAVMAALVEWIQSHTGRSAELVDWLYGAGGAACICGTWRVRSHPWLRWAGVMGLCLLPLIWGVVMFRMEQSAFPVLADPHSVWARRGWTLHGLQMKSRGHVFSLQSEVSPENPSSIQYPGLFRSPACKDWRGVQSLRTAIFWPLGGAVLFAVRVDDQPGNPPYAERFQQELSVTQGWNSITIPVSDFSRTSGGRAMQLETIRQWGVFLVSDTPFDYFLLAAVRLERPEEQP